jgi:hypothetical protein
MFGEVWNFWRRGGSELMNLKVCLASSVRTGYTKRIQMQIIVILFRTKTFRVNGALKGFG